MPIEVRYEPSQADLGALAFQVGAERERQRQAALSFEQLQRARARERPAAPPPAAPPPPRTLGQQVPPDIESPEFRLELFAREPARFTPQTANKLRELDNIRTGLIGRGDLDDATRAQAIERVKQQAARFLPLPKPDPAQQREQFESQIRGRTLSFGGNDWFFGEGNPVQLSKAPEKEVETPVLIPGTLEHTAKFSGIDAPMQKVRGEWKPIEGPKPEYDRARAWRDAVEVTMKTEPGTQTKIADFDAAEDYLNKLEARLGAKRPAAGGEAGGEKEKTFKQGLKRAAEQFAAGDVTGATETMRGLSPLPTSPTPQAPPAPPAPAKGEVPEGAVPPGGARMTLPGGRVIELPPEPAEGEVPPGGGRVVLGPRPESLPPDFPPPPPPPTPEDEQQQREQAVLEARQSLEGDLDEARANLRRAKTKTQRDVAQQQIDSLTERLGELGPPRSLAEQLPLSPTPAPTLPDLTRSNEWISEESLLRVDLRNRKFARARERLQAISDTGIAAVAALEKEGRNDEANEIRDRVAKLNEDFARAVQPAPAPEEAATTLKTLPPLTMSEQLRKKLEAPKPTPALKTLPPLTMSEQLRKKLGTPAPAPRSADEIREQLQTARAARKQLERKQLALGESEKRKSDQSSEYRDVTRRLTELNAFITDKEARLRERMPIPEVRPRRNRFATKQTAPVPTPAAETEPPAETPVPEPKPPLKTFAEVMGIDKPEEQDKKLEKRGDDLDREIDKLQKQRAELESRQTQQFNPGRIAELEEIDRKIKVTEALRDAARKQAADYRARTPTEQAPKKKGIGSALPNLITVATITDPMLKVPRKKKLSGTAKVEGERLLAEIAKYSIPTLTPLSNEKLRETGDLLVQRIEQEFYKELQPKVFRGETTEQDFDKIDKLLADTIEFMFAAKARAAKNEYEALLTDDNKKEKDMADIFRQHARFTNYVRLQLEVSKRWIIEAKATQDKALPPK